MKIHKLKDKLGSGVITNHINYLKKEGYEIIEFRLMQMQNFDFNTQLPVLSKDKSIEMFNSNFFDNIKKIQSNGGKVAILLDEYDLNIDRLPIIKNVIENNYNHFGLNENDIIFYKTNDGFDV